MDFAFNEQQRAIRDSVARFSADVLAPGYRQRDRDGRIERSVIRQMGQMGLLGGELPEAFGGSGLDCVTAGIIVEEIPGVTSTSAISPCWPRSTARSSPSTPPRNWPGSGWARSPPGRRSSASP